MLHKQKTHLATKRNFVFHHSFKIKKWGGPNKLLGGREKIDKLISVPSSFMRHLGVLLHCILKRRGKDDKNIRLKAFFSSCFCDRWTQTKVVI